MIITFLHISARVSLSNCLSVTYLSTFSVLIHCQFFYISNHTFNSTLRQGVCAESQVIVGDFMLFVLHVHTVLPRFRCATSVHTIDGEENSNVITVNSKACLFHVLS